MFRVFYGTSYGMIMIFSKGHEKIWFFSMRIIKHNLYIDFQTFEHLFVVSTPRPVKSCESHWILLIFRILRLHFLNVQMESEKNKICFGYLLLAKRSFPGSFGTTFSGWYRGTLLKLGEFGKFHHIRSAPPYHGL